MDTRKTYRALNKLAHLTYYEDVNSLKAEDLSQLLGDLPNNKTIQVLLSGLYLKLGASIGEWPKDVREAFLLNQWKWENYSFYYSKIKKILEKKNIDYIPLKGIWMAEKILLNPAQREFGDIDIWIQPKDFSRAKQGLTKEGFLEANKLHNKVHFNASFSFPQEQGVLELHSALSDKEFMNMNHQDVWARSTKDTPKNLRSMAVEDQLIYIFIHSVIHFFDRPSRAFDNLMILKWAYKNGFNEERVLKLCSEWKCRRRFLLSLTVTEWLLGKPFFSSKFPKEDQLVCKEYLARLKNKIYGQTEELSYVDRINLSDTKLKGISGILYPRRIIGAAIDRLG